MNFLAVYERTTLLNVPCNYCELQSATYKLAFVLAVKMFCALESAAKEETF